MLKLLTTTGRDDASAAFAAGPDLASPRRNSPPDTHGKPVKLADLRQARDPQWSTHQCPYVRKHYGAGNMQKMQEAARALGVTWITIISSAPGEQGHVHAAEANKPTTERNAKPHHVVLDPAGKIGACMRRVTPHMFIVGTDGKLLYKAPSTRSARGARATSSAKNYVTAARRDQGRQATADALPPPMAARSTTRKAAEACRGGFQPPYVVGLHRSWHSSRWSMVPALGARR
jgi:hypothetical protein